MRAAQPGEGPALHDIEMAASRRFADHGFPSLAGHVSHSRDNYGAAIEGKGVWVCEHAQGATPVGFAVTTTLPGLLWIDEMAVHPDHGRRGIGKALVAAVLDHGRFAFHNTVGLSTFRDVPFNAPFYERMGFVRVSLKSLPDDIRARFNDEVPHGVLPSTRTVMVRKL